MRRQSRSDRCWLPRPGERYRRQQGQPTPFHGYIYRLLTKQGSAAKGGARDYMVNGKLTRGVAFLACPAEYRNISMSDLAFHEKAGLCQLVFL
jgi:hypothetical protein